jgi:RNA polymerase sigma-70 factor (ECF subfamily)
MSGDDLLREIEAIYTERFARFYRVAFAIVRDREAAWDVVQDGFAAAIHGRDGFRGDAPLEVWLWRVVVNRALAVSKQPRAGELDDELPLESPDEPSLPGDVAAVVGGLPPRQRLVLFLRFYADLDYRGIAEVAGISVGTVSATLHAALAALRRELEVSQ